MASIPQGAFAACKLRELYRDRELMVSRMNSGGDKTNDSKDKPQNKKLLEYAPVKYNGKLMNSIWGLYNRYSPHNIKGNEYECQPQDNNKQQQIAVASFAIAQNLAMALRDGKEWCFMKE